MVNSEFVPSREATLEKRSCETMLNDVPSEATIDECSEETLRMVKAKLHDTIELLHLWKNEAYAFRRLVEAVLSERFSHDQARAFLSETYSLNSYSLTTCSLELSREEHDAFVSVATEARLSPGVPSATTFEEQSDETLRILSDSERDAFLTVVRKTGLTPVEFLWTCLDTIMSSSDDPDILQGCYDAAHRRFQAQVPSDWAGV